MDSEIAGLHLQSFTNPLCSNPSYFRTTKYSDHFLIDRGRPLHHHPSKRRQMDCQLFCRYYCYHSDANGAKIMEIKRNVGDDFESTLAVIESQSERLTRLSPGSFLELQAIHLMTRIIQFFDAALIYLEGKIWSTTPDQSWLILCVDQLWKAASRGRADIDQIIQKLEEAKQEFSDATLDRSLGIINVCRR